MDIGLGFAFAWVLITAIDLWFCYCVVGYLTHAFLI